MSTPTCCDGCDHLFRRVNPDGFDSNVCFFCVAADEYLPVNDDGRPVPCEDCELAEEGDPE